MFDTIKDRFDGNEEDENDAAAGEGPGTASATADGEDSRASLTRRGCVKASAAITGAALVGTGYAYLGSETALATEGHETWIVNGAEITTHDGSVNTVTFGDADSGEELALTWEGLNDDKRVVNFAIDVQGNADEDEWTGGEETTLSNEATDFETLAENSYSLSETNGDVHLTWNEVFSSERPVHVNDHSQIDVASDFKADDDGGERQRELTVALEVWISEEDGDFGPEDNSLGDRQSAIATVTVSNHDAAISAGGEGTFEVESDEEV